MPIGNNNTEDYLHGIQTIGRTGQSSMSEITKIVRALREVQSLIIWTFNRCLWIKYIIVLVHGIMNFLNNV